MNNVVITPQVEDPKSDTTEVPSIDDKQMNTMFSQYSKQNSEKPLFNPEDWFK